MQSELEQDIIKVGDMVKFRQLGHYKWRFGKVSSTHKRIVKIKEYGLKNGCYNPVIVHWPDTEFIKLKRRDTHK